MIANTNIDAVICVKDYADHRGIDILLERGCIVEVAGRVLNDEVD